MIETDKIISIIVNSIKKARQGNILFEEIYSDKNVPIGNNEFLFFIKPEITTLYPNNNLNKILKLVQNKIKEFDLNIHNISVLSAKYLENYNIVSQHYGIINKISSNALQNLSENAKKYFKEYFGNSVNDVNIFGGLEFLNLFNTFNAYSLDYLWQNLENIKIDSGTYCEKITIDNKLFYLVNGFHPRQLKHYTEIGRCMVVFTISGDIPWSNARINFIGSTNPITAKKGSLRNELYLKKLEFGFDEISQSFNGFHLSAGPIEALLELKRFNSDFSKNNSIKKFSDFSYGIILQETFSLEQFAKIIDNVNFSQNGRDISVFSLTEEKNSDEAIKILKEFFQ